MPKVKCSPFRATRRLCCASFPKPLCDKYGWRSCKNCDDVRLIPDRVRKVDNRKCLQNHEGSSKLTNVNIIFTGDDSSSDDSLMDLSVQENIPTVAESTEKSAGRDRQSISKKWWDDHRKSIQDLSTEIDKLEEEATRLREENKHLMGEFKLLKTSQVNKAFDGFPEIKKVNDKPTMLAMIGSAIIAILNIILFRTHQITRCRILCEAVFNNELFGSAVTDKVLKEVSRKYARKYIFIPWKVLRSLDMAINGGINYNGLEALRKVEGLEPYEQGFLPGRSSVQRCAASLFELGQKIVPVEKVLSQLGEMFKFDYEKMVCFILKAFSLHEIAQHSSVELCITLDGAELTKDLGHLTFGIKVTDS
jgi:hypothetical protein